MTSVETEQPDAAARDRAQRFAGTVVGTIVAAGVLTVAGAKEHPDALDAGLYTVATVIVLWLAHGWAQSLGRRISGRSEHALLDGLRHEFALLLSLIPPVGALAVAAAVGDDDERAITIAIWVCVAELGFFGANAARREGATPLRIIRTAVGCAMLGLTMILLKAAVH